MFNFIIFAVALVWGNNYYWMKVANCRSEGRSFVAAAIILIVVFMVPCSFIGGYMGVLSRAAHPQRRYRGSYRHLPAMWPRPSCLCLAPWWLSAPWRIHLPPPPPPGRLRCINRDIYQRLINPKADKSLKMSKIMLLIGVVTFVLCQFPAAHLPVIAFFGAPAILLGREPSGPV